MVEPLSKINSCIIPNNSKYIKLHLQSKTNIFNHNLHLVSLSNKLKNQLTCLFTQQQQQKYFSKTKNSACELKIIKILKQTNFFI